MNHFGVHRQLTQHCKLTILQLKNKKRKADTAYGPWLVCGLCAESSFHTVLIQTLAQVPYILLTSNLAADPDCIN